MNFNCYNRMFTVYLHTSPNGKMYAGITSKTPHQRWGYQGAGYKENKHFWAAIELYGWDNFKHEIVASDLSLSDACKLECDLISKYNLTDPKFGYNQTSGGNWSKPNEEVREKLRQATHSRWQIPEYRQNMLFKLKNANYPPPTEEAKEKLRQYYRTHDHPNKGKKMTLEQRKYLSDILKGKPSWSKGLTKFSDARIMKISNKLTGRTFSKDSLKKMSESRKLKYQSGYCPIWINNGEKERQIDKSDVLPPGYELGRLPSVYVTNGIKTCKINPCDLDKYLKMGWIRGKDKKISETIAKSHVKCNWIYENMTFSSACELASYLNNNGYPNIVGSTITALYLKGFKYSSKYSSLEGKIGRIDL